MAKGLKILGFISGRGSNLKSLISKCSDASFLGVISDNPAAEGLSFARDALIPTYSFSRSDYTSRSAFKQAIKSQAIELQPDLLVLAGFMQILEPDFISTFPGRIINIHPSLLPAYPGLHTHERVALAGEDVHGCTVHVVDIGVDTGPIIAQAQIVVRSDDTVDSLTQRVLEREHNLYPWVVNQIIAGEIELSVDGVFLTSKAVASARSNDFLVKGGTRWQQ